MAGIEIPLWTLALKDPMVRRYWSVTEGPSLTRNRELIASRVQTTENGVDQTRISHGVAFDRSGKLKYAEMGLRVGQELCGEQEDDESRSRTGQREGGSQRRDRP